MDHIPRPQNPVHPPISIPYYVTEELSYHNKGFSSFPTLKGFPFDSFLKNDFQGRSLSDIFAFIQSWGFFALICECAALLGIRVVPEDFVVVSPNGQRSISTKKLPEILDKWSWLDMGSNDLSRIQIISKYMWEIDRVLTAIRDRGKQFCTQNQLTTEEFESLNALLLSISCLAEMLEAPVSHHFGVRMIQAHLCPLLLERYRTSGWCLHRISALKPGIAYTSAHFFTSDIDRRGWDHDHAACWKAETCLVFSDIVKDYATLHAKDCELQTCGAWKIEGDQALRLEDSIMKDKIPAIRINLDENTEPQVEICQLDTCENSESTISHILVSHYVAISHVWLDGLGNSEENGLPYCQLRNLQRLANECLPEHEGPVAFWIDTICVPKDHKTRGLAIGAMRHVYHDVDAVLVLDRYIKRVAFSTQIREISQTILTCNWRMRLWTLHEGTLARRLLLQVSDGIVDENQLFARFLSEYFRADEKLQTANEAEKQEVLTRKFSYDFYFLPGWISITTGLTLHSLNDSQDQVLQQRLVLLTGRSTTRQEDETICLSTLLGQDANHYYELSNNHLERMKALLLSLDRVPLGLLFRSGPRIEEDGYRWMPHTFLKTQAWQPEHPEIPEPALPTPTGLRFCLPGFKINVSEDEAEKAVRQSLSVGLPEGYPNRFYAAFVDQRDRSPRPWPKYASRDLILIPCRPLATSRDDVRTIIVSFIREQEGMQICRFEALMDLIPHGELLPRQSPGLATLIPLALDQDWCVG